MRIALLSTNYDLGGAAVVTRRLCDALRDAGEDARMVVVRPGGYSGAPGQTPAEVIPKRQWRWPFLRERAELWLRGVPRKDVFKVSTGKYGVDLPAQPFVQQADAVLVNWVSQGFLSLDGFEEILKTGKPVIYTLHDLWAATALCHLPGECRGYCDGSDCRNCPYPGRFGRKLPAEIRELKARLWSYPNLRLVAVSHWQRDMALKSPLLKDKQIEVIPHPFPVELYQPGEKVDKEGKRLVVMAAARLDDPVKDLPAAVDALNTFAWEYPADAEGVEFAFVGELRDDSELKRLRVPYRHLGLLPPELLRDLYARATAVISSSKYETMGATLMEGMAAGAIPVSYGDAGQTDIITDAVNGFLAPRHDPASLAFALSLALQTARMAPPGPAESLERGLPEFLHNEVARRFSPAAIAARYLSLLK